MNSRRWSCVAVAAAMLGLVPVALAESPVAAVAGCPGGTIVVNSNADNTGSGTLRSAITSANGASAAVTICIDTTSVTTPIVLGSDLPVYTANQALTIDGNGATLNGNGHSAIFADTPNPLTVDGLTVTDASTGGNGGAINAAASLTVTNSTFTSNMTVAGGNGGGLYSQGDLTLSGSTVKGNTAAGNGGGLYDVVGTIIVTNSVINGNHANGAGADGGGIAALGAVTVTDSTVSSNTTTGLGGGISTSGLATITNSTISTNSATGATSEGGGVAATTGVVAVSSTIAGNILTDSGGGGGGGISANMATLTNSTVSGNSAGSDGDGGGIESGAIHLVYVTLVQNSSANPGANLDGSSLTSFGSVVAEAAGGGTNCHLSGATTSNGFNFTDDANATTSCHFNGSTDSVGASNKPLLGALANNGGPTQTMLPQDGPSPLIDAIPSGSCRADGASGITTDQRGLPRPDSGSPNCDIGAVEVQPSVAAPTVIVAFTG